MAKNSSKKKRIHARFYFAKYIHQHELKFNEIHFTMEAICESLPQNLYFLC